MMKAILIGNLKVQGHMFLRVIEGLGNIHTNVQLDPLPSQRYQFLMIISNVGLTCRFTLTLVFLSPPVDSVHLFVITWP